MGHLVLLKYLDPYGNTFFNHLQVEDLLIVLSMLASNMQDAESINKLRRLAVECRDSEHTSLAFYGD